MSKRDDFAKLIGDTGIPSFIDPRMTDTWSEYVNSYNGDRIMAVLGFIYTLRKEGLSRSVNIKINPKVLYTQFRQEEFDAEAALLARQLVSYRIFDVLKLYKSKFMRIAAVRGPEYSFRFDLCLVPKKKETLDSAIQRLSGMLYVGTLPRQFQEVWKKQTSKTAKPRSALPKCASVLGTESTLGFLPLIVKSKSAIFARRAADDTLVLRITTRIDVPMLLWLTDRQHADLLKTLVSKAFSKLKG